MITERSRISGLSGCLVWILLFGVLFSCLCPSATFVGGFAATLQADAVAGIVDNYLCPEGSSGEIITYQVVPRRNMTDYEMQCVTSDGAVVRDPSPDYAFFWLGMLAAGVVIVAAVLSLLLAVPIQLLIARWRKKRLSDRAYAPIK